MLQLDPTMIGLVGFACMLLLIALHVPIGIALAITGAGGYFAITGNAAGSLSMLGSEIAGTLSSTSLIVIPMFLLMGSFAGLSGLAGDLYHLAGAFVGHRKGGLAMASIAGCGGFGAACGSSVATTATMARIAMPEMERRGYPISLAAGSIAAGGTLGSLIPPSSIMLIYAFLTQQFAIELFIAGILPGLLTIALYCAIVIAVVQRHGQRVGTEPKRSGRQRIQVLGRTWGIICLITVMTVGLYGGFLTVDEAAAVGMILALLFALGRGKLTRQGLVDTISETSNSVGLFYTIIIGANIFSNFVAISHLPEAIVSWVSALTLPPLAIIVVLLLIYIALGAVFDSVAAMIVTLPFVFPLVTGLGFDPIWWGIMMIMVIEVGMITPPLGLNVFVMNGVRRDIPVGVIFRGTMPFLVADAARILLVLFFPQIALWLPSLILTR